MTSGTCTDGGPVDTISVTGEPTVTLVPALGLVSITRPEANWVFDSCTTLPTVRLAISIDDLAWACVSPTTVGTATEPGPEETVSETLDPSLAFVPPWGSWAITVPAFCVPVTWIGEPTVKPAFWSCVRAVFRSSLTTPGTTTFSGRRIRYAATPPPASRSTSNATIHGHQRRPRGGSSSIGGTDPVSEPSYVFVPVGGAAAATPDLPAAAAA